MVVSNGRIWNYIAKPIIVGCSSPAALKMKPVRRHVTETKVG